MVWNEKLKREIPEGWCVENLEYYIESITDRISASNKGKSFYTPIEVIPRKKFSFSDYAPIEEATSGLCRYKEHDILLSNRRVYFHKVCVAPSDGITRDTVIILRPQEELLGYAFQLVFSDHFISYATQHSYGSEQPVLSWESAKKYKVIKPLHCIDVRYSRIVNPMIGQILANEREIRDIKRFRDELLPLLMNGQVSVMPTVVNCDLYLLQLFIILTFDYIVLHHIRTPRQESESCRGVGQRIIGALADGIRGGCRRCGSRGHLYSQQNT